MKKQCGYSLIEVMIGTIMLAMLLGAAYSALNAAFNVKSHSEKRGIENRQSERALQKMREVLEKATEIKTPQALAGLNVADELECTVPANLKEPQKTVQIKKEDKDLYLIVNGDSREIIAKDCVAEIKFVRSLDDARSIRVDLTVLSVKANQLSDDAMKFQVEFYAQNLAR